MSAGRTRARRAGGRAAHTWWGGLAALVLVAACGSTVPHDQRLAAERAGTGTGGEAVGVTGDAELEAVPGTDAGVTTPADVATTGPATATGAGVTTGSGSTAGAPAAARATGGRIPVAPGTPGVSDTAIKIGILEYDSAAGDAINLATGGGDVNGESSMTGRQVYEAVAEYMNARGGLAGRKIQPVFVAQDVSQYATPSGRQREQQRACDAFTQDHKVFFMNGAGATEELMVDCAARHRTPIMASRIQVYPDERRFAAVAPYWYAPHGFTAEHRERGLAHELLANGFFGRGAKVGLLIEDRPGIRTGVARAKQVLEGAGIDIAAEIVYPDFLASPWDTYILQLQARGVTHVVMSATSGASQSARSMMQAAESQRWRPKWGIATDNRPKDLFVSNAPREQLANTWGMGWSAAEDIDIAAEVSGPNAQCRQIVPKGGAESRRVACELYFFLKAAFDRMTVISAPAFARAVESLGTSYVGQFTINGMTRFGPGRHDGPELVRTFTFDPRCGQEGAACFRYVGPPHPMKR
jgi:hypothetical protein